MSTVELEAVAALLVLGAVHGVNPGMGWLFAVALGLQEKRGRAVWRALPPLALGHALSVAVVVLAGVVVGRVLPPDLLRIAVGVLLLGFGLHRLLRGHRHPRYGGMRVGPRELAIWSFLMASAHGAGLMVLPFILSSGHEAHAHATHAAVVGGEAAAIGAALLHAASYLLVTGTIALVVYEKLGLRLLRSAWINLDVVWAASLIATAFLTFVL